MNSTDHELAVAAATAYEELFVPALFHQWAEQVVRVAHIQSGESVLDVACGTGVLARHAADRVGDNGFVAGLDVNPGMLAVAARSNPAIEWREGAAESIPFPDNSFDVVVSQFGLMFFNDRKKALSEMIRVLTARGRLAVAVWGALESIPAYAAEVALVERIAGEHAAAPLRAPFVLGDSQTLTTLAGEAGIASAHVSTHTGTARFPGIQTMIEADIRGWLPLMGVHLPEEQVSRILEEAGELFSSYVTPDGAMEFELAAHILTASKS